MAPLAGNLGTSFTSTPASIQAWLWGLILLLFLALVLLLMLCLHLYRHIRRATCKNDYCARIVHNLRTPLTLIKLPLDELEKGDLEPRNPHNDSLQVIKRNVDKILLQVNHLTDLENNTFSRKIYVSRYDLSPLVYSILSSFSFSARQRQVELKIPKPQRDGTVWADKEKLKLILQNFMTNALMTTPAGGSIEVTTHIDSKNWSISFIDKGAHTAFHSHSRLPRLWRGTRRHAIRQYNTSLGFKERMSLVKMLVNSHAGNISYRINESSIEARLTFPTSCHCYCKEASPSLSPSFFIPSRFDEPKKNDNLSHENLYRVLLVEQDDELATYLYTLLSGKYEVMIVRDGSEALDKISYICPDIIVAELSLPVMKGCELCSRIKSDKNFSCVPVVLLTHASMRENLLQGIESLADICIAVPFDATFLVAVLNNLLKNREIIKKSVSQERRREVIDSSNEEDMKFIARVNEVIEMNMSDSAFRVDQLSAMLNMSRSSFFNKIKSLKGETPSDYLLKKRLCRARTLFQEHRLTMGEVADRVGFSDANYLSVVYKKHYGTSPRKSKNMDNDKHGI